MNRIKVKQHDSADCAAACLSAVAAYYRLKLPLARIRQYASTDSQGTSILGLVQAAGRLGFAARGVKGPLESLSKIPLPAIAHVVTGEGLHHFIVLVKVSARYLKIMDPADGAIHRVKREEFKAQWTGVIVLLVPSEEFKPGNERIPVFRRLTCLLRPHFPVLLQVLFGALVYTLLGLSTSIFVQKIVDHVLPGGNRNLLNMMGAVMILLLSVQFFVNHVKAVLTLKTGQQIDARLILGYYRHLFRLPQRFFDTMRAGELIARVNDAFKIRIFVNDVLIGIAVNLFILLFSFLLMFTYYWRLALIILLIIPLYALIYFVLNGANRRTERRLMEENAALESHMVSALHAASTIRRFSLEAFSHTKMESRLIPLLGTAYQSSMNSLWATNSTGFISSLFTVLLLWAGAGFVLQRQITPGELLSFYALLGYFTGPVTSLMGMNRTLQDALIAAARLFEIMDLDQEEQGQKCEFSPEMRGPVCFNNVKFTYGTRTRVFDGLNLRIPGARVTAIVGESGSGKSTLSALMQRIYSPESGMITLGGVNIRYLDRQSLRRVIGVVPQQSHFFPGSLIENIALGEYEPDLKKIFSICERLGMTDFIEALPAGFQTDISENGISLSGGQRQRLAIARALYLDPGILILDEAGASLDAASERRLRKVVFSLKEEGKTIIMITHDLSTVSEADHIVLLHKGGVKESGSHAGLLRQRGFYYRAWRMQNANLKEDFS